MIKFMGDKNSKYIVTRVDMRTINNAKNITEYQKAVFSATKVYCDSLTDVWEFCGGKLHRERCGYAGINGNFEFLATRI